jgi:hypothetical protein
LPLIELVKGLFLMIHIERHPSRGQLTVFAIAWLLFFGILGGVSWWKTGSLTEAGILWAISLAVPMASQIWPGLLLIVFLGMSYATFPIGWLISHLLLALVYYGVLTPIGLLRRFIANDPMARHFDRGAETYWTPRKTEEGSERYFRQF